MRYVYLFHEGNARMKELLGGNTCGGSFFDIVPEILSFFRGDQQLFPDSVFHIVQNFLHHPVTSLASQGFLTAYCKCLQSYGIPVFDLLISIYITFKLSFHAGHFLIFHSKQSVFSPQFPMVLAKQCI